MISIIIPVYKEQLGIQACLKRISTLNNQYLLQEILVVQCEDELEPASYPVPTLVSPQKGRSAQMNHGAAQAKGEILLFLHADTILPENALNLISLAGTGAFSLGFDSPRLIFRFMGWATTLRSKILRLPYGDQAIFVRRTDFFKAGCYAEVPILEDVLLAQKIRPAVLSAQALSSPRRYEMKGIFRTVLRHRLIMLCHTFGLSPERILKLIQR